MLGGFMATKRERAVAILDAVESKARLKSRTLIGTGIAVVFLIAVALGKKFNDLNLIIKTAINWEKRINEKNF